ncbi:MAG TPA: hypothetical protein VIO94_02705 [Phenylobacterium sp.]
MAWWRAHRGTAQADPATLRALLERLKAWKAQHDAEQARQPPPFLRMAWDAIFGDDDHRCAEAISEVEAALDGA